MAYRKVDELSLTDIANTIRAKGGTSEPLTFPDGFKSAIESIQSGGGTAISEVDQWLIDFWHQRTSFDYAFYKQSIENIPLIDTSNGTSFTYMFYQCSSLTEIPLIDTSNGTNFSNMFRDCSSLTEIPQLNTSNGTSFLYMFASCSSLTEIPLIDTSNGTNFGYTFYFCQSLTTISQLDVSSGTNFSNMFAFCPKLTTISFAEGCIKRAISFAQSSLLSGESVQSIIDGLADLTGGPYQKVTFHSDIVDKLTDEQKQQVTDKNWTIG